MDTLIKYFSLSDLAGSDEESFEKIVALFADDAILEANNQSKFVGIKAISSFFKDFFHTNSELKHVWEITQGEKYIEAHWGVVGKRAKNRQIFTLVGTDYAVLNPDNKIVYLKVVGNNE
ncbi:nuclear transport factor 2 family protein [Isobaculum melis]|uniref:SnoaL-like domain-containing protein n=1 Tax=Isobaculum melis TaxID=142588 RepID=A0A1H9T2Z4_9LACT|nr:nuclear transport factor 2 family protein [Isobaculum melis]SER91632.1 SnoaL-like domain-containing protein [Isobaculum melis]